MEIKLTNKYTVTLPAFIDCEVYADTPEEAQEKILNDVMSYVKQSIANGWYTVEEGEIAGIIIDRSGVIEE